MPQLPCYYSKNQLIQGIWYFPKYHTPRIPLVCLATWCLCVEVELKLTEKPKLRTFSVFNIMNNGINNSVIQLGHKRKTTLPALLVGQDKPKTVQGLHSCGLPYQTNDLCGFPLISGFGCFWNHYTSLISESVSKTIKLVESQITSVTVVLNILDNKVKRFKNV